METLGGVVLGAVLAYLVQRFTRREEKGLQARLVVIETYRMLWGDTEFQALTTQLHRVRVYLDDAGVDEDLVDGLVDKAMECWRDSRQTAEEHFDPEIGHVITTPLLEEYKAAEDLVHKSLRKRWP